MTAGSRSSQVPCPRCLRARYAAGCRASAAAAHVSLLGCARLIHGCAGATCKINYRNPRAPIMAKVKYQDGTLVVSYDMRSRGVWTECFRSTGPRPNPNPRNPKTPNPKPETEP